MIGSWQSVYELGVVTDTLVLHQDGSFDQMYVCDACHEGAGYSFENSGHWTLEERWSGLLYLHLEGMRRCDSIDQLCEEQVGGGDRSYWDFCEDRLVGMPGEVILMVTGVPDSRRPAPRGIWLWHMAPSVTAGPFRFELVEE